MTDIIVIGGGPAGMTAALYALRNDKSVLILEKHGFGGQITYSPKVENYPGTLQMSGNEFADRFVEQILAQGAEFELEKAVSLEDNGKTKTVRTEEGGCYEAKAVILATGVKHRMLNLPGETELVGNGISFCSVCDGDFYTGQDVCMAGGGNSALQEALLLSDKCAHVTVLQDLPFLTGEQRLQDALAARENVTVRTNTHIDALRIAGGELTGVTVTDKATGSAETVPCTGLFVAIGLIPENEAFGGLVKLNAQGYFDVDEGCTAGTPGIFVAGDCRSKSVRQLTTAVGDGAVAAVAACRYIDTNL